MQEAEQCDRLLLMSNGALVAEGSEHDIIGDTTAIAVHTDDWARTFAALNAAGQPVVLDGRAVRVANGDPGRLGQILATQGIAAPARAGAGDDRGADAGARSRRHRRLLTPPRAPAPLPSARAGRRIAAADGPQRAA